MAKLKIRQFLLCVKEKRGKMKCLGSVINVHEEPDYKVLLPETGLVRLDATPCNSSGSSLNNRRFLHREKHLFRWASSTIVRDSFTDMIT